MKTKKIPFNIEKAKNGAKIVTKNGLNVTIRAYLDDKSYKYPIEAIIKDPTGRTTSKDTLYYSKEGRLLSSGECDLDLLIEEEEETDNYDPYKEVVKSISDMVERYSELQSLEDLKDFYNNVKVKCKEAFEYDKKWCKQEEQKTSNSLKIMPDKWYTCIEFCLSIDINFAEGHYYLGSDILKNCLLKRDKDYMDFFRPWNIKDAKPGDILVNNSNIFIGRFIKDEYVAEYGHVNINDGKFYDTSNECFIRCSIYDVITPATEEQCDLLVQKMKEAGYKWDSDKKELKKIESKFHKGDWVIDKQGIPHQITDVIENVTNHTYGYDTTGGYFPENVKDVKFWSIQEAKNGEVLTCHDCIVLFKEIDGLNIKCHCAYHFFYPPTFFVDTLQNKRAFYPATQEQCDLLYKKIKEEGYEWDEEKKELKKIEKKTRRMTNQELADWLRKCPEECREFKYKEKPYWVYSYHEYLESEADEPVEKNKLIRRNHGEWQEPLIEE